MSVAPTSVCIPPTCFFSLGGGSIVKRASTKVASSVMTAFSGWVVNGATWLLSHAIGLVRTVSTSNLDASWFLHRYAAMLQIALLLVGPLLGAATLGALLRQDARRLVRVWAVGLPIGILCASTAIAFTNLALNIVDALCRMVTPAHGYHTILGIGTAIADDGAPPLVQFLLASVVVLAAIVLWMELVLRATVLYIAVFFLPLGLAAFVWPATAHITKRFVEVLVAVIASKFVIVATLTLGTAAMGRGEGIDGAVTGTAILLLAAFAPYSLLKLVPLVEAAAIAHLEGTARRPAQAAGAGRAQAASSGRRMAGGLAGLMAGPEGGIAAAGVGAVDIGQRAADWTPPAPSGDGGSSGTDPGGATAALQALPGGGSGDASAGNAGTPGGSSGAGSSGADSFGGGSFGGGSSGDADPVARADPGPTDGGGLDGGAQHAAPSPSVVRAWSPAGETAPPAEGSALASAPAVAALPPVMAGIVGPDLDGWSDDDGWADDE